MPEIALLVTAPLFGGTILYAFGFAAFIFTALPPASAGSLIQVRFRNSASLFSRRPFSPEPDFVGRLGLWPDICIDCSVDSLRATSPYAGYQRGDRR